MIRLFLRFYLVAACALLMSLIVSGIFISDYYKQVEARDYVRMTRALQQLLVMKQRDTGADHDVELIRHFESEYPFVIEQQKKSQLDPDIQQALALNGVYVDITVNWFSDEVAVFYPSARADRILRFTPATDFSEPYNIMIMIIEGFILIGFAVALVFLIVPLKRHVNKLVKVSAAIGQGDFSEKANEKAPAPLDELARAINSMANQLNDLLEDKKIVMGAAAHELRTPLARLRFAMDVTASVDDQQLRQHIVDMASDLDQLELLVEEVLTFSRLSAADMAIRCETIDVDEELRLLVEKLQPLRAELPIAFSCPQRVSLHADRAAFERALSNVLRNAQRYARAQVQVTVLHSDESISIRVDDDGDGLPEQEYANILRAFYRYDDSRNSDTGGTGLGLAIVDKILAAHGGRVEVCASTLGGLSITLQWPLANAGAAAH